MWHHVRCSEAGARGRAGQGKGRRDRQLVDFPIVVGVDSGHADVGQDGGGGVEVGGCKAGGGEIRCALQLMEESDAAAVEVDLCLLEMGALPDPQVERAVRDEKCEYDVEAKDDEAQREGPREQRRDVHAQTVTKRQ